MHGDLGIDSDRIPHTYGDLCKHLGIDSSTDPKDARLERLRFKYCYNSII